MTGIRLRRDAGRDTRLDVFFQIEHEPQTVAQVSESLGLPISVVDHHLEVLREAGLAEKAGEVDGAPLHVAVSPDQPPRAAETVHRHRASGAGGARSE